MARLDQSNRANVKHGDIWVRLFSLSRAMTQLEVTSGRVLSFLEGLLAPLTPGVNFVLFLSSDNPRERMLMWPIDQNRDMLFGIELKPRPARLSTSSAGLQVVRINMIL